MALIDFKLSSMYDILTVTSVECISDGLFNGSVQPFYILLPW